MPTSIDINNSAIIDANVCIRNKIKWKYFHKYYFNNYQFVNGVENAAHLIKFLWLKMFGIII